jgi:hypothetical protein
VIPKIEAIDIDQDQGTYYCQTFDSVKWPMLTTTHFSDLFSNKQTNILAETKKQPNAKHYLSQTVDCS